MREALTRRIITFTNERTLMVVQAPIQLPFRILDETADLIAIEKPPFLLIHPSKPGGPVTLWDHLRELLAYEIASGGQVSLINRLDRETSGIVLVAKNAPAARVCSMAMAGGGIDKEYFAIVVGWPDSNEWSVQEPILRLGEVEHSRIWLKRAVHPKGVSAHTGFRVVERLTHAKHGPIALVHCTPFTGRTHQIRIHLAHSGHPVVGDKIYGPCEECYLEFIETGWSQRLQEVLWHPRHALHSCSLTVMFEGVRHRWESGLPRDDPDFAASSLRKR